MPPESTPYSRGIWPRLCVRDFARRTLAALQGTRLRPDEPCDCGLAGHALAAWRAMRTRRRKPGARRFTPPPSRRREPPERVLRRPDAPAMPLDCQVNRPSHRSINPANAERRLRLPAAQTPRGPQAHRWRCGWRGRRCGRPLKGRKRTQEQHALQELWAGEQGHSPSGFAMTLPFPLS